jgi:DnaJ-class molecular chaperone
MTSHSADLYGALGLRPEATPEQIRHAYRALVRRHHPDTRRTASLRPEDDPHTAAADSLERVLAAYAVLGDPAHRAAYDARLAEEAARTEHRTERGAPARVRVVVRPVYDVPEPLAIRVGPVRWHREGREKA